MCWTATTPREVRVASASATAGLGEGRVGYTRFEPLRLLPQAREYPAIALLPLRAALHLTRADRVITC